jgi:putative endonuclease
MNLSEDVTAPATLQRWWVYLLACEDGRTYAGVAIDVHARLRAHQCGKGAKFTRANRPTAILGMRSYATKSEALQAEHALKQLSRAHKLAWAAANTVDEATVVIQSATR